MSGEKCGFVWRDFHDDEHTCGEPGEHDVHECESCPVVAFADAGPETDDGEPVRVLWRFDVPEVPAHVTALRDCDGDVWLREGERKWAPATWPTDWRPFSDLLDFVPLVECEDPRATP